MDGLALPAVAWFALVSLLCALCWIPPVRGWLGRRRRPLLLAAGAAVAVRLLPALLPLPADALVQWDLHSYQAVAKAVGAHQDVYDLRGRYPYLPLHMYVFWAAGWVSAHTGLPFLFCVKAPAILADAALAALVGYAAAALGQRREAPALAMVFALNPVSLLVTSYHGQFDAIPVALTMGAWCLLAFRRGWWAAVVAAVLLGLAIADKTWPVLLAPVLLWRLRGLPRRAGFVVLSALPALATLALYERTIAGGARHALSVVSTYQGIVGAWGYGELMTRAAGAEGREAAIQHATQLGLWVLLPALVAAYATAARLRRDPERIGLILASMFVAAAGWGVHWLAWLAPTAIASGRRWGALYLIVATAYAGLIYVAFGGMYWVAVWTTGSLGPVAWSSTAGLIMWALLLGGALLTAAHAHLLPPVRVLTGRARRLSLPRPMRAPRPSARPAAQLPAALAAPERGSGRT